MQAVAERGSVKRQYQTWYHKSINNQHTSDVYGQKKKTPNKCYFFTCFFFCPLYLKVPTLKGINYYQIKFGTPHKNWLSKNLCFPYYAAAGILRKQMKYDDQTLSSSCCFLDTMKMSSLQPRVVVPSFDHNTKEAQPSRSLSTNPVCFTK